MWGDGLLDSYSRVSPLAALEFTFPSTDLAMSAGHRAALFPKMVKSPDDLSTRPRLLGCAGRDDGYLRCPLFLVFQSHGEGPKEPTLPTKPVCYDVRARSDVSPLVSPERRFQILAVAWKCHFVEGQRDVFFRQIPNSLFFRRANIPIRPTSVQLPRAKVPTSPICRAGFEDQSISNRQSSSHDACRRDEWHWP